MSIENILVEAHWKKYYWESTTFPRISILPVVKVRGSTILLAGGLQRKPGVDITVRKGVKYLEDQNRRYGRDKMPPLLCRILKLRESSSEQVLNNKGQKDVRVNTFLLAAYKKLPVCKFFKTGL